ncbi:25S rRNA (adenine(2142)-N(1))-methyltransferase, bmt2 domain-containing protein [Hirsutella rhossiliensis]|uniref:25S rRNA adenine-N(1) methyltransferase n=1 Tax=Hirsutella rhossiliensis TaxID=111463 RepID=A0A9P8MVS4_9HYPO|nr:25S rRNA (adenine(2142)-N(1))-methyltransferase, bmt2 domain-containing protein [Hirsutella rhossiliensis]KAH0960057.1 25S rRNA (adenine(2142)-N(1))-methyltransferase, bmt2 domain-containing protein [Hirsutella rhossiliensis]
MGSKKLQLKSLRTGRPPTARPARSMSRKASRALINGHHQLEKKRRQAADKGDKKTEESLCAEIAALGGLDHYQQASLQGQSLERGGDTSRVLLEWLPVREMRVSGQRLRMLEIGSLSTSNACSVSGLFDMVHIDLCSKEPGIVQQDFMERPLPETEADRFDIISLSLVLNFVPDTAVRGQMLARTLSFLRANANDSPSGSASVPLPSLFLVLPRSCVTNSRYLTEARLKELMETLGYEMVKARTSQKLSYGLWKRTRPMATDGTRFIKQQVNPGRRRNNFVITLDHTAAKQPIFPSTRRRLSSDG